MKPVLFLLPACLLAFAVAEEHDSGTYEEPTLNRKDRDFWAFRPPVEPPVPASSDRPIDAFLLERLRKEGLPGFAPRADPRTLLRRLHFDLTGLPPAPDRVESFVRVWRNDADQAWREEIDRLLASPDHGIRWAQHWLDLARFAETDGFEFDKIRKDAWKYRDWVVEALNADLPYDRFLTLQIAGDLVAPAESVATGFLLAGPDMPDLNLEEERRHNLLNEMTGTVGAAFLGMTMECAQCHDHKSDPVSQADFYRLRAVFEELKLPEKNHSLPVSFPKRDSPAPRHLYLRGDFRRPGPAMAPAVPAVLSETASLEPDDNPRVALARWLTRPDHPLTARVIVNRVWQEHFGRGLVGTPSDFGKLGDRPTHPELLDWLAANFVKSGWSLKWLHREILTSQAWQQASRESEGDAFWSGRLDLDPDNVLLSRQNRRRLDGEAIRDAMLSATGTLNPVRGGPGVRPPLPPEVVATLLKDQWVVDEDPAQHHRRSLYLFSRRNLRYPLFEVFDRPDGNQSCPRRHVSTTAPQALTLMNDPFVAEMAAALARRVDDASDPLARANQLLLGREATTAELDLAREFVNGQGLEAYCLALLNLNEFVYVD